MLNLPCTLKFSIKEICKIEEIETTLTKLVDFRYLAEGLGASASDNGQARGQGKPSTKTRSPGTTR